MRKPLKINNLTELKAEIARLNELRFEQEAYLKDQYHLLNRKIETPARFFRAITSRIPGVDIVSHLFSPSGHKGTGESEGGGWASKALRIGVPFLLNKFFLKRAGWLKKALVLLASETAIGQVNKDKISSAISKLSDYIRPGKKKAKKIKPVIEEDAPHFGIPPDSETY